MKRMIIFNKYCLFWISFAFLLLSPSVHAEWTPEKIREFAMKELVVTNVHDFVLYRWGDQAHELARVESKLGKGVPSFDLETVNRGNQAGGKGLYALDSVSDASIYIAPYCVGLGFEPALVEVVLKAGAPYIDLVNRKVVAKVEAVGLTSQKILDANPPAMVRFAVFDGRNPGFHYKLIWVAKDPNDVGVREFTGGGKGAFELLENDSRILDVSRSQAALEFYRARVKPIYRSLAYIRNSVTGRVLTYRIQEQFLSIALNPAEPVAGVRLDGTCGLFLPVGNDYLVSVVDSLAPEFCRDLIPTEITRDLTGKCAEVLEADSRVVLQYVDEASCQPLFCRAKRVTDPGTEFSKGGYSIAIKGQEHLNLPVDPAHGFESLSECRATIKASVDTGTGLLCVPSEDHLFKVASTQSVIAPLPEYSTNTLGECLGWIESARKDLNLLCERRGSNYEIISYRDPYQHRKIAHEPFVTREACIAVLPTLSEAVYTE